MYSEFWQPKHIYHLIIVIYYQISTIHYFCRSINYSNFSILTTLVLALL